MPPSLKKYSQAFLLIAFANGLKSAFSSKHDWQENKQLGSFGHYRQTAYHFQRKGVINIKIAASGQRFMELTKKGELELLMARAWLNKPAVWDGKWRVIFFDIPENANTRRDKLRRLLIKNGFIKLQASIYISPYTLNRLAIDYLKNTGLIGYIRIGRLEELDDDRDLRKKFNL
ncbi:MAG: CRISPR-associated endonuclease Cas2 [Candidatus Doudnabacteria bacterium]|nr:CRISPR-associated endonuclease Cas2 [Candidatus Doudnabacteria bacterium]